MLDSLPGAARDVVLLLARALLGVVLVAHGWQKFVTWGIDGTTAAFADLGVPLPSVSATFAAVVELGGGALLIIGAGTAVAGLLVAANMIGAIALVHIGNGVFVEDNGWELPASILVGALLLAAVGAGRYSIDGVFDSRREHARHRGAVGR